MSKNFYNNYWEKGKKRITLGHANKTPKWPLKELKIFYNAIEKYIGKNILDIGAGEGIFIKYLREKNKEINKIVALEISNVAIQRGKKRNPNIDFVESSAEETYPFTNNKFDTLFMTDVIEHLVDIEKTISECNRVLKRGGNFVIITPVFNLLKKLIIATFFWDKFFYPNNPHIRFFTKNTLDSVMREHGFERVFYQWGLTWFGIMPQNAYFVYKKTK